jgi:hypothetical protein
MKVIKQRRDGELQRRMDETLRVPKKDRGVSRRETTVDIITTDGPVTITEETARQMHEAGIAIDPTRY